MTKEQCTGCKYLKQFTGIARGLRCTNPRNNKEFDSPELIENIKDCQLKDTSK